MSIRAVNWARDVCAKIDAPPSARMVLWAIAMHHHDKTGECFPSFDTLAEASGIKRRGVIYAIKSLEANGLIFRQSRRVKGHQGSNHYVLFGQPVADQWINSRVHDPAPCQSARGCTQTRVHRGAPDKERYTIGGNSPAKIRVIPGGRA